MKIRSDLDLPVPPELKSDVEKLIYSCDRSIQDVQFVSSRCLEVEVSGANDEERIRNLVRRISAGMVSRHRSVPKRVAFEVNAGPLKVDRHELLSSFEESGWIVREGRGRYQLADPLTTLTESLDRLLLEHASRYFDLTNHVYPTLINTATVEKAGYLESFPHLMNFVVHLREDYDVITEFRSSPALHDLFSVLDGEEILCLSPAVCLHLYERLAGSIVPTSFPIVTARGRCYRFESGSMKDPLRLHDFSMREFICVGTPERLVEFESKTLALLKDICEHWELTAKAESATDTFFVDVYSSKRLYQEMSHSKYELKVDIGSGVELAVASLNLHRNHFSKEFRFTGPDGAELHSGCLGFGLERTLFSLFCYLGRDVSAWPSHLIGKDRSL